MLQQSEYRPQDYLSWFHRTRNFKQVARVRKLDMTAAAKGFLLFVWLEIALAWLIIVVLLYFAISQKLIIWWSLSVIIICLLAPYLLAYSLALAAIIARIAILTPQERVRDARTSKRLADHPAFKIAIAGSFGKTTMKEMLVTVLSTAKAVAATPGNLNTPAGISRFVENLKSDEEILIFELGEYFPGDITKLSRLVQPDIGVITGINEAHLSKFRSLDATVSTIYELGDWLQNQTNQALNPDGTESEISKPSFSPVASDSLPRARSGVKGQMTNVSLYVNGDSSLAAERAKQYKATVYSSKGVGDWSVGKVSTGLEGTNFEMKHGKETLHIKSQLLGVHQVGPLAAVAILAKDLGLSQDDIEKGLAATKPFEHRMEPSTDGSGVVTIDDAYNGNPDGARVAINFLASLKGHKRFYVTPGITETAHRAKIVHETIGRLLAEAGIEVVVLIETSVMEYIKTGLKEGDFKGQLLTYADEISALLALPKLTKAGDVVLLQNDWPDSFA